MLVEIVKSFLPQPEDTSDKDSSSVKPQQVTNDLTNQDLYPSTGAFFDDENGIFGGNNKADKLEKQKAKIMAYRNLSKTPDVNDALEEIVNEIIFSFDGDIMKIDIDEENDKIKDAITDKFNKILKLMNVDYNMYNIVRNSYVDGQIILHCAYDAKSTKDGIKAIKTIEPVYFYFDIKSNTFKYYNKREDDFYAASATKKDQEYSIEEIVRKDFGIHENDINLSYLEYAMKPANQLRTLEDLLIPMRFSRSISRRIFNVDIGDLPNTKGEQVMREMQTKFKYKKFYNVESGEVTNQQHVTSMVEDYWFANRSGGKGTQVDVLDESGNLGELNDILYFNKKLYKAMFIPSNRISINPDADNSYDYDSTQTTKEDIKFFMFISRIRKMYVQMFKELLRLELVSTGTLKSTEWDDYEEKIEITFNNENSFVEKMNLDNFMSKLEIYATAAEYQGKLFPVEKILKDIFKMDDEEIDENFTMIAKEKTDENYASFYQSDEEEGKTW